MQSWNQNIRTTDLPPDLLTEPGSKATFDSKHHGFALSSLPIF